MDISRFTAPAYCPQKDNNKFEILIAKIISLKQKASQILSATIEKINFFLSRKQSMLPLDKVLQWRNVKQKPSGRFNNIHAYSGIFTLIEA